MKTWQKAILLSALVVGAASCKDDTKFVVTDKGQNAIVYRADDGDTTKYVMVFRQKIEREMRMYNTLAVGDTITGMNMRDGYYNDAMYYTNRGPGFKITTINNQYSKAAINAYYSKLKRDSVINAIKAKQR